MPFKSIAEFFAMGGYGFFVWIAYGFTFVVLLGLTLATRRKSAQIASQMRKSADREKRMKQAGESDLL